jgi:hypothetical protein
MFRFLPAFFFLSLALRVENSPVTASDLKDPKAMPARPDPRRQDPE